MASNPNSTIFKSKRATEYFNAIDKVHEILEDHEDLDSAVPCCVVVGMQSVGKSAVLSRISGIRFPQDSNVCTRVAIELRLRKGGKSKPIKIIAGDSKYEVEQDDLKQIEQRLREAQKSVLNGKDFEDKKSVIIEKEEDNMPEVTLIDLPGIFFSKNEKDEVLEATVKDMVKSKIGNEMSLILHVIPLNQDIDTLSTWKIVNEADKENKRTISILTKADIAVQYDVSGMTNRIERIVQQSKSGPSECFVVHGQAVDDREEDEGLERFRKNLVGVSCRESVKTGVISLNQRVEERMLEHIKVNIPKMKQILYKKLHECEDQLSPKRLGRSARDSAQIAIQAHENFKQTLEFKYKEAIHCFRASANHLHYEISQIQMKPLGVIDSDDANRAFSKHTKYSSYSPKASEEEQMSWHRIALELQEMNTKHPDLINGTFVGYEEALSKWNNQFTQQCENLLHDYVDEVFKRFKSILAESLELESSDSTRDAIYVAEKLLTNHLSEKKDDVTDFVVNVLNGCDTKFTTNEEQMSAIAEKLQESLPLTCFVEQIRTYVKKAYDISAFLGVRKLIIPDIIQSYVNAEILNEKETIIMELRNFLMKKDTLAMIGETENVIKKRDHFLQREEKIKNALDAIKLF